MPWNEPGKGDKDPWKTRGRPNGEQPPDLESVFAELKKRFSGVFGGGKKSGGSGASIWPLVLILALFWAGLNSIHIVDEAERGIVLRFGKYVRTLQPGFKLTLPRPIEQVYKVNVSKIESLSLESQMLTGDENLVDVDYEIQYQILEPVKYLFSVRDPESTLRQAAESSMREIAGTSTMDFILEEGKGEVGGQVMVLLQEIIDRYQTGLLIKSFNFQEVNPPLAVKDAFDDAINAREDNERYKNEAVAYEKSVIPIARGNAARVRQEAEAYKATVIENAKGEAQRFTLVLSEYQKAPEVTRERLYLQAMEEVLTASPKVLMDVDQGNNVLFLPIQQNNSGALDPSVVAPMMKNMPTNQPGSPTTPSSARPARSADRGGR